MKLPAFSILLYVALLFSATTVVATESVKNVRGTSLDNTAATNQGNKFKHARVFPDVLSKEAIETIQSYGRLGNGENDGVNRRIGKALVQAEDLRSIFRAIGDDRTVSLPVVRLQTILVTGDTVAHTDGKYNTQPEKQVLIIFMNTVEGAYFEVEDEQIPVVAGSLVSFKGNMLTHRSIVPEGAEVHLLGPVNTQDLVSVDDIVVPRELLGNTASSGADDGEIPFLEAEAEAKPNACCGILQAFHSKGCSDQPSKGCDRLVSSLGFLECREEVNPLEDCQETGRTSGFLGGYYGRRRYLI